MSIFVKLNGLRRTLVDTGPAFDTILWMERIGSVFFDLIDLARTDLGAVSTAIALIVVDNRIHCSSKSQLPNPKSQTNPKLQSPMTKTDLNFTLYAQCWLTDLFCPA